MFGYGYDTDSFDTDIQTDFAISESCNRNLTSSETKRCLQVLERGKLTLGRYHVETAYNNTSCDLFD